MAKKLPQRNPWDDRFAKPTDEALLELHPKTVRKLLEQARESLLAFEGASERLEWEGLPWRWSWSYTVEADPTRALAYLTPEPSRPQLSMPLTVEMVETMPVKRLKKHVRDGLLGARKVSEIRWASWEFHTKSDLDDLLDVVKRKHRFIGALATA